MFISWLGYRRWYRRIENDFGRYELPPIKTFKQFKATMNKGELSYHSFREQFWL